MGAIALGVAVLLVLTSLVFYYFAVKVWPDQYPGEDWAPSLAEWAWISLTTLAGVGLAVLVAGHMAKRILLPLDSLARAMKSAAAGDLSARASAGERPLAEASALVEDFNRLAKELHRVTEERSFWNAAIAHELRTPVTILRGRIQGLADGVFEPDQTQFSLLLRQVEGLARLVDDLRSISLAESGHLHLQWQRLDVTDDILAAAEPFRPLLEAGGQSLAMDLTDGMVRCDPLRIRQILVALLDNARRYAAAGEIAVQTRFEGDQFILSVEDQGPGIPPELAPHVFEAFRRSGSLKERNERSSGLGLAVVAAIASAHHGTATCRSGRRGGTIFDVRFPAR